MDSVSRCTIHPTGQLRTGGVFPLFVFGVFNSDNGGFNGDCAQTKQFSYFFFTVNFKGCEENPGFAI